MAIIEYIVTRLKEVSTWQGIISALIAAGVNISPDQAAEIIKIGLSVLSLVSIFFPQYFGGVAVTDKGEVVSAPKHK